MSIIASLLEHSLSEFAVVYLHEAAGGWSVGESRAFRKAKKRYAGDQRIMGALNALISFIQKHPNPPPLQSYPPELSVRMIRQDKRFGDNAFWAHLKGQKIGVLFTVEQGQINFLFMGTQQDIGWS